MGTYHCSGFVIDGHTTPVYHVRMKSWILLLLLVLVICQPVVSQTKSNTSGISFLTGSFTISGERLPKGFRGHDPQALFEILARNKGSFKDELDTSATYLAKLKQNRALSLDSVFAVLMDPLSSDFPAFSYDADQGLVSFTFRPFEPVSDYAKDEGITAINFATEMRVHTVSHKSFYTSIGISITNPLTLRAITFKAIPARAREVKSQGLPLIIFRLREPHYLGNMLRGNKRHIRDLVVGQLEDVWIVNPGSGEIYAKMSQSAP